METSPNVTIISNQTLEHRSINCSSSCCYHPSSVATPVHSILLLRVFFASETTVVIRKSLHPENNFHSNTLQNHSEATRKRTAPKKVQNDRKTFRHSDSKTAPKTVQNDSKTAAQTVQNHSTTDNTQQTNQSKPSPKKVPSSQQVHTTPK